MARAIWLALAFASLASGARYVDYSESKMPEYGGAIDYEGPRDSLAAAAASEDYHDRLPDVPASLDYDETGISEKPQDKVDDSEQWQKLRKKRRKSSRSTSENNVESLDKYNSEEINSNVRPDYRINKYRPRPKYRSISKDEIIHKRPLRFGRYRKEVMSGIDSKDTEEVDEFNNEKGSQRASTARIARRKPREKMTKPNLEEGEQGSEAEPMRRRFDTDYFLTDEELQLRPTVKHKVPFATPVNRDDDLDFVPEKESKPSVKSKKIDDYSDYYDMKRVQGIKDKLPILLRRSTTTLPVMTTTWNYEWIHRRKMIPDPSDDVAVIENQPESKVIDAEPDETTPRSTTTTETTTTTTTSTTTTTTTPPPSSSEETKELSVAEKSRLSILKKAQRKEMTKSDMTNKPPVLMQVTNKMQTVIMVEPPGRDNPLRRANVVPHDEKHDLNKVKRLMRHKLVANAKNIHDLTDNWDDMVCDYIDVNLLKSFATAKVFKLSILIFCILIHSLPRSFVLL